MKIEIGPGGTLICAAWSMPEPGCRHGALTGFAAPARPASEAAVTG